MALALMLGASAMAEVKLDVYYKGAKVGTATDNEVILVNGKKSNEFAMEAKLNKVQVFQTRTSLFDPKGNEISLLVSIVEGGVTLQVVVHFDSKGAHVAAIKNHKKDTLTIEPLPHLSTTNPTEFWFCRDQPKIGQKVVFQTFDAVKLGWRRTEITYKGRAAVKVAGKTLQANVLLYNRPGESLTEYLDDHGMPLLFESQGLRMERAR